MDFIAGQVRGEKDPTRCLERFFEAGFAFVAENLAQARVLVNNIYGPDPEFKQHMFQAYQPMFQLVGGEILAPGIAQGIFREVDLENTTNLLMTVYLGTCSQVSEDGRIWLDSTDVAAFALDGLRAN